MAINEQNVHRFKNKCVLMLRKGIDSKSSFNINLSKYGLLKSHKGLTSFVLDANRKQKPSEKATFKKCQMVASILKLDEHIPEQVHIYAKSKSSGGYRVIANFDLQHRAAQLAVSTVLGTYYRPRPFQFSSRGVSKAIIAARKAVASGLTYAAEVDIRDFYGSFSLEKLATELPLPKGVVEHAVVGRHMEHVTKQGNGPHVLQPSLSHTSLLQQARLGIPQGSACSPLVSAYCVARLDWPSASDVVLLNYADNFFLLAPSMVRLKEAIGELTQAITNLPGGTFLTEVKQACSLKRPFMMLGRKLQIRDGSLTITVSEASWERFFSKLNKIEAPLGNIIYNISSDKQKQKALSILAAYYSFGVGWIGVFKECDDIKDLKEIWEYDIIQHANYAGLSLDIIRAAVDSTMEIEDLAYESYMS